MCTNSCCRGSKLRSAYTRTTPGRSGCTCRRINPGLGGQLNRAVVNTNSVLIRSGVHWRKWQNNNFQTIVSQTQSSTQGILDNVCSNTCRPWVETRICGIAQSGTRPFATFWGESCEFETNRIYTNRPVDTSLHDRWLSDINIYQLFNLAGFVVFPDEFSLKDSLCIGVESASRSDVESGSDSNPSSTTRQRSTGIYHLNQLSGCTSANGSIPCKNGRQRIYDNGFGVGTITAVGCFVSIGYDMCTNSCCRGSKLRSAYTRTTPGCSGCACRWINPGLGGQLNRSVVDADGVLIWSCVYIRKR